MNSRPKITIVIPTFNRPHFLRRNLLYYYELNYPHKIIVVDSSHSSICKENQSIVAERKDVLDIYYEYYPHDKYYYTKIAQILDKFNSNYSILCGDKDFLVPEGIYQCVKFLEQNSDYSIAHGVSAVIYFDDELIKESDRKIFTWSKISPNIEKDDAASRLKKHLNNFASTFYSVHRHHQLKRNWQISVNKTMDLRFGEVLPSCLSIVQGKAKRLDFLYHVRQYNSVFSAAKKNTWNAVLKEDDFEFRCKMFVNCLSEEIASKTGIFKEEARSLVKKDFDVYMAPIKESFNKYQEFKSNRNLNHKYFERIMRKIYRLKRVLPVAMQLAPKVNQFMPMIKSPLKTYRKIGSRVNDHDRAKKKHSEPGNALHINKLLDPNSQYYADFKTIQKIVKCYPDGIFH